MNANGWMAIVNPMQLNYSKIYDHSGTFEPCLGLLNVCSISCQSSLPYRSGDEKPILIWHIKREQFTWRRLLFRCLSYYTSTRIPYRSLSSKEVVVLNLTLPINDTMNLNRNSAVSELICGEEGAPG